MAYGLQVFNSSGQTILDSTSDKQGIGQVSGSVSLTTNGSGNVTSSPISFPGMDTIQNDANNPNTYDVFLYGDTDTGDNLSNIGITRGEDSFIINVSNSTLGANVSIIVYYVGLEV